MKVLKSALCLFLCLTIMGIVPVNANEKGKGNDIVEEFQKLQDDIDESLTVDSNGKYVFTEVSIRNKVKAFDVKSLNDYYGTEYTNDSLADSMIKAIEEFQFSEKEMENYPVVCTADNCGINRVDGYWNFRRYFCDYNKTNEWIKEERNQANFDDVLGLFVPFGSIPLFVNSKYCNLLADALASNNGDCGTITDINTFTSAFTVVPQ